MADRYAKSVSGNVPEPEHPPQKRLRKRIENVSLILRFQTPPRRTETHWKRIENAPGRRREERGNAKNVFNAFPKAKEETHWKRFRKRCRKRIENVRGENGKKADATETFRKRCLTNQPPKTNEKQTLWKRSERFLAAQKRKRNGNAMETLRAFPKTRKRNRNALKTLGAFPNFLPPENSGNSLDVSETLWAFPKSRGDRLGNEICVWKRKSRFRGRRSNFSPKMWLET